jgi:hypothetical protein
LWLQAKTEVRPNTVTNTSKTLPPHMHARTHAERQQQRTELSGTSTITLNTDGDTFTACTNAIKPATVIELFRSSNRFTQVFSTNPSASATNPSSSNPIRQKKTDSSVVLIVNCSVKSRRRRSDG